MQNACQYLKNTCLLSHNMPTCVPSLQAMTTSATQICLPLVTPAPNILALEATEPRAIPTYPDTGLPWSEDFALGGWSARMFLHQLLCTSRPAWKPSDTEQSLSEWTPLRIQGKAGKGITLSDVIKPAGKVSEDSFRTSRMVQVLIRRALARGRSFRLLLHTERDTTPVIVMFGTREQKNFAFWTVKSEKPLPDSLAAGLLDYLKAHAPKCMETRQLRTVFIR